MSNHQSEDQVRPRRAAAEPTPLPSKMRWWGEGIALSLIGCALWAMVEWIAQALQSLF